MTCYTFLILGEDAYISKQMETEESFSVDYTSLESPEEGLTREVPTDSLETGGRIGVRNKGNAVLSLAASLKSVGPYYFLVFAVCIKL